MMEFGQLKNRIMSGQSLATLQSKTGSIGIDFGTEQISLVQIKRKQGQFKIHAALTIPFSGEREELLKDPFKLKSLIKPALKANGFYGRSAVAALPPTHMQLMLVNYHCEPGQDHKLALQKAISDQLKDRIQGSIIDYIPIHPKVEEQLDRSALVAIANHEEVTLFLETLRLSGLNVKVLEIGPVAIKRLISSLDGRGDCQGKIMAINFASNSTFVTVLWGGELLLDREIRIGQDSIISSVSEALNVSVEEANKLLRTHGFRQGAKQNEGGFFNEDFNSTLLQIIKPIMLQFVQEIKKVLIYTSAETRGGALNNIYILGSLARWPMVDEYLSTLINLPIKTINPFFGFSVNSSGVDEDGEQPVSGIAVATGLALQGLEIHD